MPHAQAACEQPIFLCARVVSARYTEDMNDEFPTFDDERNAPQLSREQGPNFTGLEPLLGGARRAKADSERITLLLNTQSARKRHDVLAYIQAVGQADVYAEELATIAAGRAEKQFGTYRGRYDTFQRINATRSLEAIGGYEAIIPLMEALAVREYELRDAARQALIAICSRFDSADPKTAKIYQVMVRSLGMLPSVARKVITQMLATTEPDLVLGPLIKIGLRAETWQVRREVAWTLGKLADQRATQRLVAALEDETPSVRATAAWALGQLVLDEPVVLQPLARHCNDPDQAVRAAVVQALGDQLKWLPTEHPDFRPTLKFIAAAFDDREDSVRQAAMDALTVISTPQTRKLLRQLVEQQ